MFPPVVDDRFIGITREPETEDFTLHLASGDSYRLSREEVVRYFKLVGIEDFNVLDYVRNFYRVIYDKVTGIYHYGNPDQFRKIMEVLGEANETNSIRN